MTIDIVVYKIFTYDDLDFNSMDDVHTAFERAAEDSDRTGDERAQMFATRDAVSFLTRDRT